jgi:PST family polysaccharide transporter
MNAANQSWTNLLPPSFRERLHGRIQLQKILSNIIWLSLDKFLRLGVGAVVGVWIARYLGPAQFGILNYTIAFVALFSPLGSLGVESILVRDVLSEDDARRKLSLGTAFALRCAGSLAGAILACSLIGVFRPGNSLAFGLVAIAGAGLVVQSFDVIDLWFQSQVRAKFAVYAKNAAFLILSITRVGLLVAKMPLITFAWATLAESTLGAAGLVLMYRRTGEHLRRWRASMPRAGRFLKDSWPLAFANLATILYMRIGQVMLGNILSDREVGVYSVAIRLAEMWYFIPMSIASSVFPSVIKAKREDAALYGKRLEMFYSMMSMISLSVAAVTFLFADTIITVIFGAEYVDAGPVLSVYIWASVPVFLNIASSQHLIADNRTSVALYRTLAGAATNILLNIVLIPKYGVIGAAVAALLSYCVTTFCIAVVPDLRDQVRMMLRSLNPILVLRLLRGGRAENPSSS